MDTKVKKEQLLAWAYSILKDKVDNSAYGYLQINIQDGVIMNCRAEETIKPIIDDRQKLG